MYKSSKSLKLHVTSYRLMISLLSNSTVQLRTQRFWIDNSMFTNVAKRSMGHFCEKIRIENVSASYNVGNRRKTIRCWEDDN
jgi:hypothetical protein